MCYSNNTCQTSYNNTTRRSYWRLNFVLEGGIKRSILTPFNIGNVSISDFMAHAQSALYPYSVSVKSLTMKLPVSTKNEKTSEVVITSQANFLYALSLVRENSQLYDSERGMDLYVNKDEKLMSPNDSGYTSENENR